MASIRRSATAAVSAALLLAGPGQAQIQAPISVRVWGGPAPNVIAKVAEVGQPYPITLSATDTLRSVIESRCGTVELEYVGAFLTENRLTADDLGKLQAGSAYQFPMCLPAPTTTYRVRKDDLIENLFAQRKLPFDGRGFQESVLSQVALDVPSLERIKAYQAEKDPARRAELLSGFAARENALRFARQNKGVVPTDLKPDDVIRIDSGQRTGVVPLRATVKPAVAVREINVARDRDRLQGAADTKAVVASQIGALADEDFDPKSCTGVTADWPYSVSELQEALKLNARFRTPGSAQTIMVLDTGFDSRMLDAEKGLPSGELGKVLGFRNEVDEVEGGINAAQLTDEYEAPDDLPDRLHGSEIAILLRGSGRLKDANVPLPKVVFGRISVSSPGTPPYLDIAGISTAYRQANGTQSGIRIVNASVAAPFPHLAFQDTLKAAGGEKVLVIAAAGNIASKTGGPQQLFTTPTRSWPGALGGDWGSANPGLVVSVGAHNPTGDPLPFSRLGRLEVDLLAPGCLVPTSTWDEVTGAIVPISRNGTSYAAPIVAYASSLLITEGLRPALVKQRLIMSVDVDADLIGKVYSSGRFDMRKALSVHRDYITYLAEPGKPETEKTEQVVLQNVDDTIEVCSESIELSELRKLAQARSRTKPGQVASWIGWRNVPNSSPSKLAEVKCSVGTGVETGVLTFKREDGSPLTVPIPQVVDFVKTTFNSP